MPLQDSKREALELLSEKLSGFKWCVFGSVDHALRGFEVEPDDIDILATEKAAEELRWSLPEEFEETRKIGSEIESTSDVYRIKGEEVELIYSTETQEPLLELQKIELEEINGLPVLPEKKLIELYRKIGKHDRANELET